jgi:MSHA biogenesis protein MshJ
MKLPPAVEKGAAAFNRMSMRERLMISGAVCAAIFMIWMTAAFDPISAKQRFLTSEMVTLQETIAAAALSAEGNAASDPVTIALAKEKELQGQVAAINAQLASESGGLIAPERMIQVIHDVLARQRGVSLVSLHNKPVSSLIQPGQPAAGTPQTAGGGPYVHPVELVVEASYMDLLAYLRALEGLQWHFYWKVLELETIDYPLNRVRIELSTLSMDTEWIGM